MKYKKYLHFPLLNNSHGVGLLLVMSSIALLTFILATFTYNTSLNKIKVYNEQDSMQARLSAESGLNFALSKLKMYQEAFNMLEKNETLKSVISTEKLEGLITQPFIFPLPVNTEDLNLIQKTLINEFTENTYLNGEVIVEVKSISNFLNPNNLSVPFIDSSSTQEDEDEDEDEDENEDEDEKEEVNKDNQSSKDQKENLLNNEQAFIELLTERIQEKIEEDEDFASNYSDVDPVMLVKELKYYVSRNELFKDDQKTDIEILYSENDVEPKHAPMEHISELYQLAGWDDQIVNLIIDRLSVYAAAIIPINEINDKHLKLIFPELTEDQLQDFFFQRDGNEELEIDPTPLNSFQDFKKLCTETLDFDSGMFQERTDLFLKAGYHFGPAGKLFKITSSGKYNNSTYAISAFVDLPILPQPEQTKSKKSTKSKKKSKKQKPPILELMEPRVINIGY
jgi:hypothetical protein